VSTVEPAITDDPATGRYVLTLDGEPAGEVAYRLDGDHLLVDHTEVDERYEGQGLGGRLARHVLDDARSRDLRVVPFCPSFRAYLERHPEHTDIVVPIDDRG
jgi:uncharacterized protein